MSAWFYDAAVPSNFTAAGGVAGLGEIADAAEKQMRLVDNTNSSYQALYDAYDARIAAVHTATGQTVENPLRIAEQLDFADRQKPRLPMYMQDPLAELKAGPAMPTNSQKEGQKFSEWLQGLEAQFPDKKDQIRAGVPLEQDALALAKGADEDLGRLMASRTTIGGFASAFYGGFKGTLNDPLQVATMFAGAGPGTGRTIMARLANVALKEALINGAVEAAQQPTVQDWREKAGLPSGFDEGLRNVVFAAGIGGLFGAGTEALGMAGRRALTGAWLDKAADHAAKTAPLRIDIKRALAGDADAALNALRPIREALPPETRAAIDLHETLQVQRAALPDASPVHEKNLDAALKTAIDPEAHAFEPEIDRAKIDRIVAELVPDAPPARKSESASLQDFLIRAGGVQDQKSELSALGLQNASQKFKGRLVKETGRTLDDAREIAAEAGYFNHRYGTSEEAVQKSTIADLLDELDSESRRIASVPEDDGGRRYVEARVDEMLRKVGPEVDEKLVARAVQLAEAEKIDPIEAFDRVAMEAEGRTIDTTSTAPPARIDDPLRPADDFIEPDAIDEAAMFTSADLEDIDPLMDIPFFDDGRPATATQIIDDLNETDWLFQVTEACRA